MTTQESTELYHEQVKKFFAEIANQKARETKFVQRTSPLDGSLFLLSLVLTVFQHGVMVLDQLAVVAHKINDEVVVTGQAFKERFNELAVVWLQGLLVEALRLTMGASGAEVVAMMNAFSAVYLLDSSTIALPDSLQEVFPGCGGAGAKAAVKLYLLLNWLTGEYETMHLEAGRKADQNMGQRFLSGTLSGALWIFDLGFFNFNFFASIAQGGSYFLCRLQAHKTIWCSKGMGQIELLDLDRLLQRAPRQMFELNVWIGSDDRVPARLIAIPAPRAVAVQRRHRVREAARTQRRTPSQQTLNRCDWTLLLTNASDEQLPTSTVLQVYGVRWQVELAFKLFKSDAKLEQLNATEKCRVQCEFYAKLIALLSFNKLTGLAESLTGQKISPVKLFRRMRNDVDDWLNTLGAGTSEAVSQSLMFLASYATPSRRKTYPSTRQRLEAAAQTAQVVTLTDPLGYLQELLRGAQEITPLFRRHLSTRNVSFQTQPVLLNQPVARHEFVA